MQLTLQKLQSDMSNPLYNNATRRSRLLVLLLKPITAIAALEEGAISLTDTIDCTGVVYDQANPPINCWIFREDMEQRYHSRYPELLQRSICRTWTSSKYDR